MREQRKEHVHPCMLKCSSLGSKQREGTELQITASTENLGELVTAEKEKTNREATQGKRALTRGMSKLRLVQCLGHPPVGEVSVAVRMLLSANN